MKNLIFIFFGMLAFAACNSAGSSDAATDTTSQDTTATQAPVEVGGDKNLCYIRVEGKDSTSVSVTIRADNTVTGTYDWSPLGKDGAHGTLNGRIQGDMVTVVYDYTIEGANQKEEKLFKMTGDLMAEAFGELEDGEGGMLTIKKGTQPKWKPLGKVDCK